ncbi:hypothetical protein V5E43_002621 [Yersinia enterocolitica]|uniref:Uncharacterized phage-encoded protein n=2 Tax=Yersinia enterocolitica TaxID=630 RepID=A0A0T7P8L7_YEREN|nr:BRO family protein [Yersinia enterocolitica]EKN3412698.1 hypothetical protein [Yersinia enterocolitica]EKN3555576.1 hypothetical protein [Yersinia enterocolitica]EKN4100271.1 hypothetical protein [Yersinia enterocolitica]EKN6287981.1 hypothetical protein [Yersinia enterocolitica]EKN6292968.1 hypothetical protein [Yersinia enterocolitica]
MNTQTNTSIAAHVFAETSTTIRTVTIGDDIMFIAKDVAEALGYKDTKKAIAAHCKRAKLIDLRCSVGGEANHPPIISAGNPNAKAIPESDVYRLIMRSKLQSAERFEEWVVEEVLPNLRKHGGYMVGQETLSEEEQAYINERHATARRAFTISGVLLNSVKRSKATTHRIMGLIEVACQIAVRSGDNELDTMTRAANLMYQEGLFDHCRKRVANAAMQLNHEYRRKTLESMGITDSILR